MVRPRAERTVPRRNGDTVGQAQLERARAKGAHASGTQEQSLGAIGGACATGLTGRRAGRRVGVPATGVLARGANPKPAASGSSGLLAEARCSSRHGLARCRHPGAILVRWRGAVPTGGQMGSRELTAVMAWCHDGEGELVDRVLLPMDLEDASALPGWTKAHIVSHLARNADALVNLVTWAATGVVTPMYPSTDARGAQIEADVPQPADWLRERLRTSSARLLEQLDALAPAAWEALIETAQGRTVPASEIPWMRVRESFIHLVDLDLGFTFADFPGAVTDALLDDVTAALGARPECPAVLLEATDRTESWTLGEPGAADPALRLPAWELLAWVTGRGATAPDLSVVPTLPRWL